jgi:hypothetical protein
LRRLSSRLNSASGAVIAVRWLQLRLLQVSARPYRESTTAPQNRPQADRVVLSAWLSGTRPAWGRQGGAVRCRAGTHWVKLGQNGHPDEPPAGTSARWTSATGQVTLNKMLTAFISCRPRRIAGPQAFGVCMGDWGFPTESRDEHPCLSRLCLTSGCTMGSCPTNPWGVGRAFGLV